MDLSKKKLGTDHPHTLIALNNLGSICKSMNDVGGAKKHLELCLPVMKRNFGEEHPETLICMNNLAAVYSASGDFKKAIKLYSECVNMKKSQCGELSESTVSTKYNLASVYMQMGDFASAEPLFNECLQLRENADPKVPLGLLFNTKRAKIVCLFNQGKYAEAESDCKACFEAASKELPVEDAFTQEMKETLREIYGAQNKRAEADALK